MTGEPTEVIEASADDDAVEETERRRWGLTRQQQWWLLGILVTAFALRLAWGIYALAEPPVDWFRSGDQFSYYHYGKEIAAGNGYQSYVTGDATAYYPIGYPAILSVVFWLANHTPLPNDLMLMATLFHVLVSTATVALVFVVGRALFGPRTGLVAAGIMAVWPNHVYQVASLQLETTFIFLAVAAVAVIVTHDWSTGPPDRRRLVAFGLVLGLSVMVRPFSIWFLVGLLVAVLATGAGWRRAAVSVAWPALVVVVMAVPWTIRNAVAMDSFVPSSTNMGDTLCLDRNLDAKGGFRFADHDGCVDPGLPEVPRNRGNTRKAIEFVIEHPDREALQIVRRARIIFEHDHDGLEAVETLGGGPFLDDDVRRTLTRLADWYFFAVLVLAVAGLPTLVARRRRPPRLIVLVALLSLLAVPLLLWGNQRFHLPLLPFMAVAAAGALQWAYRHRPGSRVPASR